MKAVLLTVGDVRLYVSRKEHITFNVTAMEYKNLSSSTITSCHHNKQVCLSGNEHVPLTTAGIASLDLRMCTQHKWFHTEI